MFRPSRYEYWKTCAKKGPIRALCMTMKGSPRDSMRALRDKEFIWASITEPVTIACLAKIVDWKIWVKLERESKGRGLRCPKHQSAKDF